MSSATQIDMAGNTSDIARWIWRHAVPKSGQADSIQGETLRAIEKLRREAQMNGNINWGPSFERLIDFLHKTFTTAPCFAAQTKKSISDDLSRLRQFSPPTQWRSREDASNGPYVDDDLYNRLIEHLVCFCRLHPHLLPHEVDPLLKI